LRHASLRAVARHFAHRQPTFEEAAGATWVGGLARAYQSIAPPGFILPAEVFGNGPFTDSETRGAGYRARPFDRFLAATIAIHCALVAFSLLVGNELAWEAAGLGNVPAPDSRPAADLAAAAVRHTWPPHPGMIQALRLVQVEALLLLTALVSTACILWTAGLHFERLRATFRRVLMLLLATVALVLLETVGDGVDLASYALSAMLVAAAALPLAWWAVRRHPPHRIGRRSAELDARRAVR
jgi:hypothetical protein